MEKIGESLQPKNTVQTYKSVNEFLNLRGGVFYHGKLSLRIIKGSFNKVQYKDVFQSTLLPWANTIYRSVEKFILQ